MSLSKNPAIANKPEKRCPGCGIVKPRSDYNTNSHASDGMSARCRECKKALVVKQLAKNAEESLDAAAARFWPKVEQTDTCWLWRGAISPLGYGKIMFRGNRSEFAHRVVLVLQGVEVPDRWTTGLVVDHTCGVRHCVRPDHLRIVSQRVNTTENSGCPLAKNAAKTHCPQGHPYSGDNVAYLAKPKGVTRTGKRHGKSTARVCLTCYPHTANAHNRVYPEHAK